MAQGKVDRRKLISHRFPVEQVRQAFETQGNGAAIKVIVQPDVALAEDVPPR
jgi:threonine dehydrogenase-like Zn-dependent dehydrogenase